MGERIKRMIAKKRGRPRKNAQNAAVPPIDIFVNEKEETKLKDFQKLNLKEGDMVSVFGYKTMGMLVSEVMKKDDPYYRKNYRYMVTVQLFKERGEDSSRITEMGLEFVKKFHAWPYFYKKTPKQMKELAVKESALNSSEDVV